MKIGSEAKLLALDPNSQRVQGDTAGAQTVVLEFDSMDKAKQIYESGEYQEVLPTRLAATSNHFAVLIEGYTMPT